MSARDKIGAKFQTDSYIRINSANNNKCSIELLGQNKKKKMIDIVYKIFSFIQYNITDNYNNNIIMYYKI